MSQGLYEEKKNHRRETNLRPLSDFAVRRRGSVDPKKYLEEQFELFSIPAYDVGEPERLRGAQIGSSKKVVEPGDVLISRIVPHIQRVWVVPPGNGCRQIASGEWIVFRHKGVAPEFLRHMLLAKPFHNQFMQTVAGIGGSLLRARPKEVERIQIPVPKSINEQTRIAAILDKADVIRQKRAQSLTLADEFLNSAFLEIFGDPLKNPKHWPTRPLGDYLEEIRYGTSTKCWEVAGRNDVPVLRIPNIVGGFVYWNDLKYTNLPQKEFQRLRMKSGDILFVRTNGNPEYIGRCAVFDSDTEVAFASYLIRARLREDSEVTPLHVRTTVSMPSYRHRMIQEAKTTAGNYNVNTKGLRSLPIIEAPKELQASYGRLVSKTLRTVEKVQQELRQADSLHASLSQLAFRSEI